MKKLSLVLATSVFAALSLFVSCDSNTSKVQEAKDKVQNDKKDLSDAQKELMQAEKDSVANFEQYRNAEIEFINGNDKTIASLKEKMKTEKKEMRDKHEAQIDVLEKKNNEMQIGFLMMIFEISYFSRKVLSLELIFYFLSECRS